MMKYKICVIAVFSLLNTACLDNFLDREPKAELTPENYLTEESQLASYAINLYEIFPTHENFSYGTFGIDKDTDNQAGTLAAEKYTPGQWRVPDKDGEWNFEKIFECNYFLNIVQEKYDKGEIRGDITKIRHYLGEVYMLRAYEYFTRVMSLGDFPIITETFPNDRDILTQASKRMPHSEVVRFILKDLDTAIELMMENAPDGKNNRLSRNCALLFKSRVALYEATWLKYFKNTAFVPDGPDWLGKEKDYNQGYQYQAGGIEQEIEWLLDQSMEASKIVADKIQLTENTGILPQTAEDYATPNPYLMMFGSVDMSVYPEVLLWRKYDQGLKITHAIEVAASGSNGDTGATRGLMESFLMQNGLPIYDSQAHWGGDDELESLRKDRDSRLRLFLRIPGQKNILINTDAVTHAKLVQGYPDILFGTAGSVTGYLLRKGTSFDGLQVSGNGISTVGSIVFRAVEAYLNYMEASYEKNGVIDATAEKYWKAIRRRAKVDEDYSKTIAATRMEEEASKDWGAYSAGNLIDPTLYNIRRERRCELMAEGLRDMDLGRWRAKDQMIETPYHIEGFKLYNSTISTWYQDGAGNWNSNLTWGSSTATVSDPAQSDYLRPFSRTGKELVYNGYRWAMAHYWHPIAVNHFLLTSNTSDYSDSPIYQNPGWPTIAGQGATK